MRKSSSYLTDLALLLQELEQVIVHMVSILFDG